MTRLLRVPLLRVPENLECDRVNASLLDVNWQFTPITLVTERCQSRNTMNLHRQCRHAVLVRLATASQAGRLRGRQRM